MNLRGDRRWQGFVAGRELLLEVALAAEPPIRGDSSAVEPEADTLEPHGVFPVQ
jgi:hypothetical protein